MEIPLLTGGESKVYIALVELNESYIGNIIKNSKVSHSKIYDILKRLAEKGLVSSINKNGKKYFVAANPSRLNNLIDKEKDEIKSSQIKINEIVEILNSKKGSVKNEELVSSFEGINGMKTVLEMVIEDLKEDDVVYTMIIASKSLGDFSLLETFILGPTGVSNRVISEYFVYATNFNAALALVPREKVKETCETL